MFYYLNKSTIGNPNNDHEVHKSSCYRLPSESNRIYLGFYNSCSEALKKARTYYLNVDACVICCPECHKR